MIVKKSQASCLLEKIRSSTTKGSKRSQWSSSQERHTQMAEAVMKGVSEIAETHV